jgi:hypothetical protein
MDDDAAQGLVGVGNPQRIRDAERKLAGLGGGFVGDGVIAAAGGEEVGGCKRNEKCERGDERFHDAS